MAMRFEDLAGQRFQEDLRAAAGYSPITKDELKSAYDRYKDVGVKIGRVKGKSDAQLYKQATNDVVSWYKAQKKSEADAKAAQDKAAAKAAADQKAAQAAAKKVSSAYVDQVLAQNGFSGARVPDYALKSKEDFDAWVRRAIRYRQQQSGYYTPTPTYTPTPSTPTQTQTPVAGTPTTRTGSGGAVPV